MKQRALVALTLGLVLAQPERGSAETSATPNALEGSETVNALMDDLFHDLGIVNGVGLETYNGAGSSCGERQMTGNPLTSEPACTDTDGGENVGCQEISPMSREMSSSVCAAGNAEAAGQAEGIAFCRDAFIVLTDNATFGQYAEDAAACAAFEALPNTSNAGSPPIFADHGAGHLADGGMLPLTGYVLGAGSAPDSAWKDILRIIYTGCLQGDGDCVTASGTGTTSTGVPSRKRSQRCDSPVRRELLSSWRHILAGEACDSGLCEVDLSDGQLALPGHRADDGVDDTGLRHAYRREDASGTTAAFLELIGVRSNLTGRAKITATAFESTSPTGCSPGVPLPSAKLITPIPEHFAFCDGGSLENWAPDCQNNTIDPIGGDPIRKDCSEQDDLCGPDQKAAVVQAIKSARGSNPYPTHQCSRGQFAKRSFLASPHNVCPDGSKPSAGQCKLPFFAATTGGPSFHCLNPFNSRPATVPSTTDGRTYNIVMRTAAGVVDQPSSSTYEHASWRQNMAKMALSGAQNIFGKAFAPADYECTELSATRNLSCVIARSTCSIGFASREAAYTTANDDHLLHEPLPIAGLAPSDANVTRSGGYPLARSLWLNAIGGMEQITAQCLARGDAPAFCDEQKRVAEEFWGTGLPGNIMADLCSENGFVPLPRAEVFCKGVSNSCGAPLVQTMSDCIPM